MNKRKLWSLVFVTLNIGSFIDYEKWWNADVQDGRHYVLVSAEWCEPCKRLKAELRKLALANGQDIVVLDTDRNPETAKRINPNGMIPLLLEYTKTGDKWTVRKYEGKNLAKFLKGE